MPYCRNFKPWSIALAAIGLLLNGEFCQLWAQRGATLRQEFSLTVELPEIRNESKNLLAQVEQQLKQRRWFDAIESLDRLNGAHGAELIFSGKEQSDLESEYTYFKDVQSYLQRRIANFCVDEPEFLETYRDRIDTLARQEFDAAVAAKDIEALSAAVDRFFLSSHTDQALVALGDLLLEQGRFFEARTRWQQIGARYRTPDDPRGVLLAMPGQPLWIGVDGIDWTEHRTYVRTILDQAKKSSRSATLPDSDIDPASIYARLCLASWLEGANRRASVELQLLRQLYPDTEGPLNGSVRNYYDFLASLLATESGAGERRSARDWPTYAGNTARNGIAKKGDREAWFEPLWSVPLTTSPRTRSNQRRAARNQRSSIYGPADFDLSFFPIVVGETLVVSDMHRVRAFKMNSGRPAFPVYLNREIDSDKLEYGMFHAPSREIEDEDGDPLGVTPRGGNSRPLGARRFTLASQQNRVVARLGTTMTGQDFNQWRFVDPPEMLVFDMAKEGMLAAQISPEFLSAGQWTFEGTALIDGNRLYCGMVEGGIRDRSILACFDWSTGMLLWKVDLGLTQPYGSGLMQGSGHGHRSHNLATLKDGVVYYNTNRGVIAAIDAASGQVMWVTRYPRRTLLPQALAAANENVKRDLVPCLVAQGMVLAMPLDSDRLFALDAATGQVIWQTVPGGVDPMYLLGTTEEDLLVSGERLTWIHLHSGKIRGEFPSSDSGIYDEGYGRGVLVGDEVFWPTLDKVYRLKSRLLSQRIVEQSGPPIDLAATDEEGGNLVYSQGRLAIASSDRLTVYQAKQSPAEAIPETQPK